jgi:transcriptional regulator with XRE-family HTH domain
MNKVELQGASGDAMDLAVGRRIRELRRARDLPLTAVAERTGLSIGFLSQVERGLSSPSLRVLTNLADVFGVALGALFGAAEGEPDPVVVRAAERPELKLWRSGISKQLLTPAAPDSRLNLYLVRMEPEASTGDEFYTHQGEEAGLVLEGAMILTVDTDQYRLERGDSFRFASTRPHRFSNPLPRPTLVVWINSLA